MALGRANQLCSPDLSSSSLPHTCTRGHRTHAIHTGHNTHRLMGCRRSTHTSYVSGKITREIETKSHTIRKLTEVSCVWGSHIPRPLPKARSSRKPRKSYLTRTSVPDKSTLAEPCPGLTGLVFSLSSRVEELEAASQGPHSPRIPCLGGPLGQGHTGCPCRTHPSLRSWCGSQGPRLSASPTVQMLLRSTPDGQQCASGKGHRPVSGRGTEQ